MIVDAGDKDAQISIYVFFFPVLDILQEKRTSQVAKRQSILEKLLQSGL